MNVFTHSPVTEHTFRGKDFYLKRDDLLHPQFSGNKARKLMPLLDAPLPQIKTLISYGSPQANSLYSFAALAQLRGWQFEFYVDHIPHWLATHPIGNYKAALALGAKIYPTGQIPASEMHPCEYIRQVRCPDETCLVIPEGGRCDIAQPGVAALGDEIIDWIGRNHITHPVIALPSGTGTTALYLHQHLTSHHIQVLTCACVGGESYLQQQWDTLGATSYPTVLSLPHKHNFGKLYREDYAIWLHLCRETRVEFDLLYDPMMWRCLELWLPNHPDTPLIYIHQGGLLGNTSMQARYQRKYPELPKNRYHG
ncbi:1-aminocyclopropane-1-carboxylate deaminase/D-cysteine desulfhydrase [Vibrio mangrovi]|uniref:D-cysteine desulfhydrase n=1 Tax=Vibrio mangrovi TaxID=474394 RepID=A0A1Y6IP59_9VIBR|nr:1-aminocyclopropane-1-carboxylate deaminase/D-cysteine desulfhydrase [Vibrio mangrovi]MDW6003757.1 1-aminocyclopropane-1-carboxylate deaminase/D-cysteine desulfhydrase [Vibrio mangrovi]SMR99449.1 D-cysteine desulfhydrase [Vibrio mangrovi]